MFDPLKAFATERPAIRPVGTEEPYPLTRRATYSPGPVATLVWAENGGPIRTIIDGAKTRPTGFLPVVKSGFRAMPWDSQLEERAMQLADLSSRVHYVLAQPHRMEIKVRGNRGRDLIYFPDLMLRTDPSFVDDLRSGARFIEAVAAPTSHRLPEREWETVIIEIKADVDSRDEDEAYRAKLEFAKEVYSRKGFHFFEIRASAHLTSSFARTARLMDWRKNVAIDEFDLLACRSAFRTGLVSTRDVLERALGGGAYGRAKLHGLHYRQLVSVDLQGGIDPAATVYLMRGEQE
jgi:hypothetical protein